MLCKIGMKDASSKLRRDAFLRRWAVPVTLVPSEALCDVNYERNAYASVAEVDHREEGTDRAMCNDTSAMAMATWQTNARAITPAVLSIAKKFVRLLLETNRSM